MYQLTESSQQALRADPATIPIYNSQGNWGTERLSHLSVSSWSIAYLGFDPKGKVVWPWKPGLLTAFANTCHSDSQPNLKHPLKAIFISYTLLHFNFSCPSVLYFINIIKCRLVRIWSFHILKKIFILSNFHPFHMRLCKVQKVLPYIVPQISFY